MRVFALGLNLIPINTTLAVRWQPRWRFAAAR
jgi:hypothetical protein